MAPCIVTLTTFTSPCNSIPNYNIYKIPNQQNAWIFIALLQTNPTLVFLSHYHVYCAQKIPETVTILELWIRQQFTLLLLLLFQIWMHKVSTVHSPECAEVWKIETLDHLTFTIKSLIYYFKSSIFLGCWISITLLWFFFFFISKYFYISCWKSVILKIKVQLNVWLFSHLQSVHKHYSYYLTR